jgi:hypothetical protein
MHSRLIVLIVALFFAAAVHADRMLPPVAKLGEMKAADYPYVKIGDSVLKFSPGARIFNIENRMILPNLLPAKAAVFFQLDLYGQVINLWLATPEEAARSGN